jgi:HlyD family secretion protein
MEGMKDLLHTIIRKPIVILGVSAGIFALLVWPNSPSTLQVAPTAPLVTAEKIYPDTHQPTIILHGKVQSQRHATLKATMNADVVYSPHQSGHFIEKDADLMQLGSSKTQLAHAQSKANLHALEANIQSEINTQTYQKNALKKQQHLLELVQKDTNRQQYLYHHQQTSLATLEKTQQAYLKESLTTMSLQQKVDNHANTLQQLQAQYQQTKADLDKTYIDVKRLTIKAPFSGYITQLLVDEGDRVAPNTPLVAIYDPQSLAVQTQIPRQYAQQIEASTAAITATLSYQQQPVALQLTHLSKHIEAAHGSTLALFEPKTPFTAPIGQWFKIKLALPPTPNSFIVPEQAIYHGNTVYKIQNRALVGIPITILGHANTPDHAIIITSQALYHGDTLLTTHLPNAITGMQVTPTEDDPP